jgi:hypothetical protein
MPGLAKADEIAQSSAHPATNAPSAATACFIPGKAVFHVPGPPLACRQYGARWIKPIPSPAYPRMRKPSGNERGRAVADRGL